MADERETVLHMAAVDDLYRACRSFCTAWEEEPRKEEGLASDTVVHALRAVESAAAALRS